MGGAFVLLTSGIENQPGEVVELVLGIDRAYLYTIDGDRYWSLSRDW
jgi:hypothetical protein